jgi:hypothetical protein
MISYQATGGAMIDPSQFATEASRPSLEEALNQLDQCTTKSLFEWICGRETTSRSAAIAAIASSLFGSDAAVAERLHRGRTTICGWRHGTLTAGDNEPGIGVGNRQDLCELVVLEMRRRQVESDTPDFSTDYHPSKAFVQGEWIRHNGLGLGRILKVLGKGEKIDVLFQGIPKAKTLVAAKSIAA